MEYKSNDIRKTPLHKLMLTSKRAMTAALTEPRSKRTRHLLISLVDKAWTLKSQDIYEQALFHLARVACTQLGLRVGAEYLFRLMRHSSNPHVIVNCHLELGKWYFYRCEELQDHPYRHWEYVFEHDMKRLKLHELAFVVLHDEKKIERRCFQLEQHGYIALSQLLQSIRLLDHSQTPETCRRALQLLQKSKCLFPKAWGKVVISTIRSVAYHYLCRFHPPIPALNRKMRKTRVWQDTLTHFEKSHPFLVPDKTSFLSSGRCLQYPSAIWVALTSLESIYHLGEFLQECHWDRFPDLHGSLSTNFRTISQGIEGLQLAGEEEAWRWLGFRVCAFSPRKLHLTNFSLKALEFFLLGMISSPKLVPFLRRCVGIHLGVSLAKHERLDKLFWQQCMDRNIVTIEFLLDGDWTYLPRIRQIFRFWERHLYLEIEINDDRGNSMDDRFDACLEIYQKDELDQLCAQSDAWDKGLPKELTLLPFPETLLDLARDYSAILRLTHLNPKEYEEQVSRYQLLAIEPFPVAIDNLAKIQPLYNLWRPQDSVSLFPSSIGWSYCPDTKYRVNA